MIKTKNKSGEISCDKKLNKDCNKFLFIVIFVLKNTICGKSWQVYNLGSYRSHETVLINNVILTMKNRSGRSFVTNGMAEDRQYLKQPVPFL